MKKRDSFRHKYGVCIKCLPWVRHCTEHMCMFPEACYNESPMAEVCSIIVLKARSLKSRRSQAALPLQTLGENPSLPPSFWWLLAFLEFLGLWPHHSNLPIHGHTFNSVCLCLLFCLLQGRLSLDLGST